MLAFLGIDRDYWDGILILVGVTVVVQILSLTFLKLLVSKFQWAVQKIDSLTISASWKIMKLLHTLVDKMLYKESKREANTHVKMTDQEREYKVKIYLIL